MMTENTNKKEFKKKKKAAKQERKEAFKDTGKRSSNVGNVVQKDGIYAVEGITTLWGGTFEQLYIEGICTSKSDINATSINIEGIFNCDGSIVADSLYCEGTSKIDADVRAESMQVAGMLHIGGRLEASSITCEGYIHVDGEISADLIDAEGIIVANEIFGDKVVIRSEVRGIISSLFLGKRQIVDLIEATNIELCYVKAKEVNGENIRIGKKCIIDRIDCSGTLYIDPTARVGEVTGEHTRLTQ